jgi:P pilus assembly chaperone PapD
MKGSCSKLALIGMTATLVAVALGQAPGDLVVTPTKVVLDDKSHSGDITLVNRGMQAVRYRLTLIDMEMSESGALRRVQGDANSATDVLRLSPREVLLEPGVSQRIKIAVFFPKGMADRELRSHLSFEPISTPRPLRTASQESGPFKLNFELRSVVTIPVIVRHGRLAADASISDASISRDASGPVAVFKLSRTGSRSVRGDARIVFTPTGGGQKILLGQIVGLPVYFPNADRIVTIRLTRDPSSLGKGEVEISFAEPERSRGAAMTRMVIELAK